MNKKQETVQAAARQPYEKPTMQVYELEAEEAILDGGSSGAQDGGYFQRSQATGISSNNPWNNESII